MGLMINPAPTFTLNDGSVASEGKLYFYENGSTTIEKAIYLDSQLTTQLNNPLTLTDAGRLPTCFGTGTYTIVLESAAGVQQWVRNDVSIDDLTGQFADYSTVKNYKINEIVRYTDGNYYYSSANNNKGNTPSVNSEWWSQIAFLEFFNTAKAADADYMLNDIVISGGFIYRSLEDNNGDTPPSAKWANLTFNDSVAGNFTVGGDLSVSNDVEIGNNLILGGFSIKYYQQDKTADGSFTSGTVSFSRIGRTVTVSGGTLTHTSASSASTTSGFVPVEYRPPFTMYNTYDVSPDICRVSVNLLGLMNFTYYDSAGASTARTSTGSFTISYNI